MKGQAQITEYVLTIFLMSIITVSLITLFYWFYRMIVQNEVKRELREITVQISDSILKLYSVSKSSKASPGNYTAVLISEVNLNLPRQVAKKNYYVSLISSGPLTILSNVMTLGGINISTIKKVSGAKIYARTVEDPVVVVEEDVSNIDVILQGKSENGVNSTLQFYRYNINGLTLDTIILGGFNLLARISTVS